jgi:Methylase involved in ubiquinone/menaquinone biosynthesis
MKNLGEKSNYWDKVAKTWQVTRPQILWRAHSDAINTALLARWLSENPVERLLKTDLFDESVGEGLYPFLSSRALSVVGIDLSFLTIQAAKSRYGPLQATGADVRCLPFTDGAFDVVFSNSTLDHFESEDEIIASLRELSRVLREGGQLLITLDNMANPFMALRNSLPFQLLHRLGIVPYYVGASFGPRRLRSVLRQLNFEVIEVSSLIHSPRVIAVPLAGIIEKHCTAKIQRGFLRLLSAFEMLSRLPTRFITGHFIAARAIKR